MKIEDLIFSKRDGTKKIYESLIEDGRLTPEQIEYISGVVDSDVFNAICILLTIMSDRQGRHEERKEDSFAAFPHELKKFIKECKRIVKKNSEQK